MTVISRDNDVIDMSHCSLLFLSVVCSLLAIHTATAVALCDFTPSSGNIIITNVTEDWPINSSVGHIDVTGNDGEIDLTLTSSRFSIALDRSSRNLTVVRRLEVLDHVGLNSASDTLSVTCQIRSTSLMVTARVFLTVFDINDHAPTFNMSQYTAAINEMTAEGQVIARVSVTDLDPSDIGYLSFSIDPDSSPFASYFDIRVPSYGFETAGEILLKSRLSLQQTSSVSLTIVVTDNSNSHAVLGRSQPQFNATTTLIVTISSTVDYNPVFTRSTYTTTLDRLVSQGTSLTTTPLIEAFIPNTAASDAGNRPLTYSIVTDGNEDDSGYFSINNVTGQLMTSLSFVASTPGVLSFQIKVSEQGAWWRYGSSLVKVTVTGQSSTSSTTTAITTTTTTTRPPLSFTQSVYNMTMAADSPAGSLLIVLSIHTPTCSYWTTSTSGGGTNSLLFSFVNSTVTDFSIDSRTGEIRTSRSLNYDVTMNYTLKVKVTDGHSTSYAWLYVTVQRTPFSVPNSLQFTSRVYTFNASRDHGDVIGSVQAVSSSPTPSLSYSIIDISTSHPGLLSITPSSGQLRLAVRSVSSDVTDYTVVVVAADDGRDATVVVVVRFPPINDDVITAATVTSSSLRSSGSEQRSDYLVALIIIGVVGGVLLLVVIGLLIFVSRKTSRTCDQVQSSRSDLHAGSLFENGFRATDDFRGLTFQPSSTDGAPFGSQTSAAALQNMRGQNSISSNSGKQSELSVSVDSSGKLAPGFYGNTSMSQASQGRASSARLLSADDNILTAVGMDPGTISSTETLMGPSQSGPSTFFGRTNPAHSHGRGQDLGQDRGQDLGQVQVGQGRQQQSTAHPTLSFVESNQSSVYMSSPDGSLMSVATQAKSDDGTGITVYY